MCPVCMFVCMYVSMYVFYVLCLHVCMHVHVCKYAYMYVFHKCMFSFRGLSACMCFRVRLSTLSFFIHTTYCALFVYFIIHWIFCYTFFQLLLSLCAQSLSSKAKQLPSAKITGYILGVLMFVSWRNEINT